MKPRPCRNPACTKRMVLAYWTIGDEQIPVHSLEDLELLISGPKEPPCPI